MRTCIWILALGFANAASAATCAPDKLVHIVMTNVSPGVSPASYIAQPKRLFRIGQDRMRSEEEPDPVHHIQTLAVIAEPDLWMVNLSDGDARHIIDPGPTFVASAPVFAMPGVRPKLLEMEFGCEAEFVAANESGAARSELVGGRRLDVHRVVDGPDAVEVLDQPGTHTPAFARYYRQGKLVIAIRYDVYETGLPDDPALFMPPGGVSYQEMGRSAH